MAAPVKGGQPYPFAMAVIHAEPPLRIAEPEEVGPDLRLTTLDRERRGGTSGRDPDADLGRFVDAPVVLGVRDPIEFRAILTARSAHGDAALYAFADVAMRESDGERAVVLRAHASTLTLALITVLDPDKSPTSPAEVPPPVLSWSLTPRSADATARADMLDFLRVVHQGGELEIVEASRQESVGRLDAPGAPFDADLERDWRFMSDVATLEEWSGMALPVPSEVPAVEVARIQQAAEMVRTREARTAFTDDLTATVPPEVKEADELQLEQDFAVEVFGFEVPLGTGRARFPVRLVESRADPDNPDLVRLTFHPATEAAEVVFTLEPPPGRLVEKRTLAPGEEPPVVDDSSWSADWEAGEREAETELRTGRGVRFASEEAFFSWLLDPGRGASP